jgi:hypothetical protein
MLSITGRGSWRTVGGIKLAGLLPSPAARLCRNANGHGRSPTLSGRYVQPPLHSARSLNCEARYRAWWISPRRVVGRVRMMQRANSIISSKAILRIALQMRILVVRNLAFRFLLDGHATVVMGDRCSALGDIAEDLIFFSRRIDYR